MTKNSEQAALSQEVIIKDDLKKKTNKPFVPTREVQVATEKYTDQQLTKMFVHFQKKNLKCASIEELRELITSLDYDELVEGEFFDDMGNIRQGSIF